MFILCVAARRLMLRVLCRYFSAVGDGGAAGLIKDIILDTGGNLNWLTVRLPCARLLRAITLCLVSFLHAFHVPHPVTLNPFPSRIISQPVSKVDSNTQTAAASGSDFIGTPRALRLSCGSAGSTFVISEGNACVLPTAPHVFKPVALPACAVCVVFHYVFCSLTLCGSTAAASTCISDCDCCGARTCSPFGFCSGAALNSLC